MNRTIHIPAVVGRACKYLVSAAAVSISLTITPQTLAANYAAVVFAGDYPGPPAFDDHLSTSSAAFAANLATWPNWSLNGPNPNITLLPGNTTAAQFEAAIAPYAAGGANALGKGDFFLLFYFGHGTKSRTDGLGNPASERAPAYDIWEEGLYFPDGSVLSDNALTADFKNFAPGVIKAFVNISCYSGGFWGGNNPGGIGDLEQVPTTLLMASSIEPLSTMTGNLAPRPSEPVYLHNLILNLNRNGRVGMTLAQWHYLSFVPGTVTGFRFDDPSEPAYYAIQQTVDQEEALDTDDPGSMDDEVAGSLPVLSISYVPGIGPSNTAGAVISWPADYIGSTLQQTAKLDPANWTSIPGTTATNSWAVAVAGTANFYRLSLATFPAADLELTCVGAPNPVKVGGLLTYTMTVSNIGTLPATNVVLVDMLSEDLDLISSSASEGSVSNSQDAMDSYLGTLNPGQSATVTVVAEPTVPGLASNSVEVVSDSYEVNWANNHATAVTTVTGTAQFYPLTVSAGTNGTVFPLGTITNYAGQRQFISASPDTGYWVDTWYLDGVPAQTGGSFFLLTNIQSPHSVLVTFRTQQYIIEVTPPTNGVITPAGTAGEVFVDPGTNQTFNASPSSNYTVGSWAVDGSVVQTGGTNYTFYNIQTNHTLQVTFNASSSTNRYSINSSSDTNGMIVPSGLFYVAAGTNQTFTAVPNSGFTVAYWYLNGVIIQTNGTSFTLANIQSNVTVFVTFQSVSVKQYLINSSSDTNGMVAPSGSFYVLAGTNQTFTATPNAGFTVAYWYLNGVIVQTNGTSFTLTNIQSNETVFVTSQAGSVKQYRLNSSSGFNGTINPDGSQLVNPGSIQYLSVTPAAGFVPWLWYLNGVVVQTNGLSYLLTNTQADDDVFVTFEPMGTNQLPSANTVIGADAPPQETSIQGSDSGVAISLTEGNLSEHYHGPEVDSAFGPTMNFTLAYNSYNADGSRAQLDAAVGYGWTHSFNIFLFSQGTNMFRFDGSGRITKYYAQAGGTTFLSAPGYFETLVSNPNGSFTLTNKNKTVWTFASVPGTPFTLGSAVYPLVQISDRNQNITTLNYSGGTLATITDTYGRTIFLGYNASGQLFTVIDPLGRITTLQYDANTNLTSITDPLGKTVQYGYDPLHQLTQKTDRDGRVFTFTYQSGEPTTISDALAQKMFTVFGTSEWATNPSSLTNEQLRVYVPSDVIKFDGRGNTWNYFYDTNGCVTFTSAPDGSTTSYSYDPATVMPTTATDANNNTTVYQYDSLGNLTNVIDPMINVTSYTYDSVFNQVTTLIDPNGRTNRFQYDSRGNLTNSIDPLGQSNSWTYDTHGNVLTETDNRGNTTVYLYDAQGNQTDITDALGDVTQMAYDSVGNLTNRIDANEHATGYVYDGLNRNTEKIDPAGNVTVYSYDGEGNRVSVRDADNNTTVYVYDYRQRLVQTVDALGHANSYAYDANDNRTNHVDRDFHTTSFTYDLQNHLTTTGDALGEMTTIYYDRVGNTTTNFDALGYATIFTYDPLNRLTTRTDPVTNSFGSGAVTVYEYASPMVPCCLPTLGSSLLTGLIDAEGKATYYNYDALDRVTAQIRKQGPTEDDITTNDAVTYYAYDPNGNEIFMTNPVGNVTSYLYDALNRQTNTVDAAGDTTSTAYDGVGNIIDNIKPNLNNIINIYDQLDRVTNTSDSIGLVSVYSYDNVGNLLTRTDGNNNTTTYYYDNVYRVTATVDPLGKATTCQYDAEGNETNLVDRNGNSTTYAYDAVNRCTNTVDALNDTNSTAYDQAGNVMLLTDARGGATYYQYDGLNRYVSETYPDGYMRTLGYDGVGDMISRKDQNGIVTTYQYDDLHRLTNRVYSDMGSAGDVFSYDLSGRMTSASSASSGYEDIFAYDGADRLTNDTTENLGESVSFYYDIPARIRVTTYPGGYVVTNTTDFRDRLERTDDAASTNPVVLYSYDLGDRIQNRSYRGGAVSTYAYNTDDWITQLQHRSTGNLIAGFTYTYDNEGNRLSEQNLENNSGSETYAYDAVDRMTNYTLGTTAQESWELDAVGNWVNFSDNGVVQSRMYNSANEVTDVNATNLYYDNNGNLTYDGASMYVYDEENRLVELDNATGLALYSYDALGRRVGKLGGGSFVVYFYDGARPIEEQDVSLTTQATYVYGAGIDEVLAMTRNGTTYYCYQNALGSVVAATTDTNSSASERYSYDAYGSTQITDGTGTVVSTNSWGTAHSIIGLPCLFTGRQFDEESGLYFYRSRHYSPSLGRFVQRDSMDYLDNMNLYEYVGDNPATKSDAFGYGEDEDVQKMIDAARQQLNTITDKDDRRKMETWIKGMSDKNSTFRTAWLKRFTMNKNIEAWKQIMKDKKLSEEKAIMEVLKSAVIPTSVLK